MKNVKTRYILKGRNKPVALRTAKELVLAEISAGFKEVQGDTAIYSKFQISLECQIKPEHFGVDEANYKFDKEVFNKYAKQNAGVRTRIRLLETAIDEVDNHFTMSDLQPTAQEFKQELFIRLGRAKRKRESKKVVPSVLSFLLAKIANDEKNIDTTIKGVLKENSIKSYRTLSGYLQKYELYTKSTMKFSSIDDDLWWDFWDVQDKILRGEIILEKQIGKRKQTIKESGFKANAIKKYQVAFARTLRLAKKVNIEFPLDITDITLIVGERPSHKDFYVTQEQLEKIIHSNPVTDELKEARDYVILSSLTGMRYQSMVEASKTPVERCIEVGYDFSYIHSKQGKTNTECVIPLLKPVLEIVENNQGRFPVFSENTVINKNVKDLFEMFDVTVIETIYPFKGKPFTKTRNINELISTHDFRKSFYTNLSLMKLNESVIDGITHPDKAKANAMAEVYNKSTMLDKAKLFVDEVMKATSEIYTF